MVRLTRLRIDRFRNVKPGTDLRFGPTFNVLLGKNATGKSTLLDLIAAVTNDDLSGFANEEAGLDLTWWLERDDPATQVQQRLRRTARPTSVTPQDAQGEMEFENLWTIVPRAAERELGRVEVRGTRGAWKVADEEEFTFDVPISPRGNRVGATALFALRGDARLSPPIVQAIWHAALLLGTSIEPIGRFDEALNFLDLVSHKRFEVTTEIFRYSTTFPDPVVEALMRLASRDPLVVSFDDLGALAKVPGLLGFASAELRPRVLQKSGNGKNPRIICEGFDYLFQRADGSQISYQLLSFGQKRLFAFLWYLAIRQTRPVVADELLNGLHHEWIEICLERLRERQSFLATQDPWLLDHVPVESAAAARTTFVRCALETGPDGREIMAWRNFDEEEAERFFVAYQTGIQHVSEVLRTEGLW